MNNLLHKELQDIVQNTSDIDVELAYIKVQHIQHMLFDKLILETPCSGKILYLTIRDVNHGIKIDESNLNSIIKELHDTKKRYIPVAISMIGHYGIIFLDRITKKYWLFDPSYNDDTTYDKYLATIFLDKLGYTYIPPTCYVAIQYKSNDDFCSLWSFLMAYLLCRNIDIMDVNSIHKRLSEYSAYWLRRIINGFIYFLYGKIIEYDLMKDSILVSNFDWELINSNIDSDMKFYLKSAATFSSDPRKFIEELGIFPEVDDTDYGIDELRIELGLT